jgi:hypothetical protein
MKYTLFILMGENDQDATSMLKAYLEYLKLTAENLSDAFFSVNDIYTGKVYLRKSGKYLVCARGNISEDKSRELLEEIVKSL